MNIIAGLVVAIATFLAISFPVYLVAFIVRRIRARKLPPGSAPSIVTLVVYILVVFPIAMVPVQNYRGLKWYSQTNEIKENLMGIFDREVAYMASANTYARSVSGRSAFEVMGWKPGGETDFAYFCDQDAIWNTKGERPPIYPGPQWPFTIKPGTSESAFTCLAVGNLDWDDFPEVWSINDAKDLTNVINDLSDQIDSGILAPDFSPPTPARDWTLMGLGDMLGTWIVILWLLLLLLLIYLGFRDGGRYTRALKAAKKKPTPDEGSPGG